MISELKIHLKQQKSLLSHPVYVTVLKFKRFSLFSKITLQFIINRMPEVEKLEINFG